MNSRTIRALLIVSLLLVPSGARGKGIILEDFLTALQKKWDTIHSYQADFNQKVTSKALAKSGLSEPAKTEGKLSVIKPDNLRWESQTDGTTQILNGKKIFHIQPNRRRKFRVVDIFHNAATAIDMRRLSFLAGKTPLKSLYQVTVTRETPRSVYLKLKPKQGAKGETYIAEIDKESYLLASLVTDSADSTIDVTFTNVKLNVPLGEELFIYKKLPDDVVHDNW